MFRLAHSPMALPRPSNQGILVSAVLVGGLGLCANYFMQLDPSVLASLFRPPTQQTMEVSTSVPVAVEDDAPDDVSTNEDAAAPLPLDLTMPELVRLEELIKKVHSRWEKFGHIPSDYRETMPQIATRAVFLKRQIANSSLADGEVKRKARLSGLSIAFFCAEMDPEALNIFRKFSNEVLIECESEADRARTTVLRLLVLHDYEKPNGTLLLRDLQEFSDKFDGVSEGIFLYQSVAKKLDTNGFRSLSNQVLQQGIRRYRDSGSKVNRLINDLISQDGEIPRS